MRVGTERTNHHITQEALPASQVNLYSLPAFFILSPPATNAANHRQPRPTTVSSHPSSSRAMGTAYFLPAVDTAQPNFTSPPLNTPAHHHDQSIKSIVAAGPWELPTPCQSPMDSRQPHHHHHPTDTIRPDTTPRRRPRVLTRTSTTKRVAAGPLGTAYFLS